MKRPLLCGTLAILFGLSLACGTAYSQLPPLPDTPAPMQPESVPQFDDPPVPPPMHTPSIESPRSDSRRYQVPQEAMPHYPAPQDSPTASPPPPGYHGYTVVPSGNAGPTAWQPGGYEARRGSPYYYTTPGNNQPLYSVHQSSDTPWAFDHSAYQAHFGPGYYRHSEGGHYRFPYYSYRAPWYFPGHPVYNRDTNRPW